MKPERCPADTHLSPPERSPADTRPAHKPERCPTGQDLSLRDYRQNQVMKKVTSWAAIIAVPTLITGYYGMNVPYPGSGEQWGVALSGLLVVVISAGLFTLFRKRDWL